MKYGSAYSGLVCQPKPEGHKRNIIVNQAVAERLLLTIFKHLSTFTVLPNVEARKQERFESCWESIVHRHLVSAEDERRINHGRIVEMLASLADSKDQNVLEFYVALKDIVNQDNTLARHREGLMSDLLAQLSERFHESESD